jgi:hypothetical protein
MTGPHKERGPGHHNPDPTETPGHEDRPEPTDRRTHGPVTRVSPLAGLVPVPCQCSLCRWHRVCDKAIEFNGAVRLEGSHSVMVVADVVVAEVAGNCGEIPETYRLVRDDGRSVYVSVDDKDPA